MKKLIALISVLACMAGIAGGFSDGPLHRSAAANLPDPCNDGVKIYLGKDYICWEGDDS
jgi:hypothetical protein